MSDSIHEIAEQAGAILGPLLSRALTSGSADDWRALESACNMPAAADLLCAAGIKARELRHPSSEKLLAAALSLAPFHLRATLTIARSYLGRGLNKQAQKLLADLHRHKAGNGEMADAFLDELLLRASQAAGASEDAKAAAYRLAIDAGAHWSALLAAADFFRSENDLDAQRTLFTRLTTERPDDPDANLLMASWLHDEGYDNEAARRLNHAALLATSREQRVKAKRLLFEIQHPEDDAQLRKLTQSFFAVKPVESLPLLKRLTQAHPDLAEAWLFYGFALRRDRQLEAAAHAFERCVKYSDDPNAHKELAAICGELREHKKAERHARRALELLGEHDRISWINLAAALLELRKPGQAREALAKARELDPASPQVNALQEDINLRSKPMRGFYNARLVRL